MSFVDITVRPARLHDVEDLTRVQQQSWRNAYEGLMPESQLRRHNALRNSRWWRRHILGNDMVLVLDYAGHAAGYLIAGSCQSGYRLPRRKHCGEITEFYLLPVFQGLGFGARLMAAAEARFRQQGFQGYLVNVLAENDKARRIYEHRGGRLVANAMKEYARHGDEVLLYYFPLEPSDP